MCSMEDCDSTQSGFNNCASSHALFHYKIQLKKCGQGISLNLGSVTHLSTVLYSSLDTSVCYTKGF